MNVIYKVTDTLNNLSYIGSKMNYVENSEYLGSPVTLVQGVVKRNK